MKFQKHSDLKGLHAFLGASKYHWLNYDEDKLKRAYFGYLAVQKGTELHEFAAQCIRLGQKLPRSKKTLNLYVNDAIGYNMTPEQVLYYSNNCFGTADAICYRDGILRIHDLKTGQTPASIDQLMIYAGLFCLEYHFKPEDLTGVCLRIYQSDNYVEHFPTMDELKDVISKIKFADEVIERLKQEE